MATKSANTVDQDTLRVGKAVRALREERRLTQEQAATAVEPQGWTSQYWGMIETGRVSGVHKPAMQRKIVEALSDAAPDLPPVTVEDLGEAMGAVAQATDRIGRMARELQPSGQPTGAATPADLAEVVFPTRAGRVSIRYPEAMSADAVSDLEIFLKAFVATLRA